MLILHIEVPGFNTEGIAEYAREIGCDPVDILVDEVMRAEVGLVFVTVPAEKSLNHEFEVVSRTCTIVGADIREEPALRGEEE